MLQYTTDKAKQIRAVKQFTVNLENSCDMGDRKVAVQELAKWVGVEQAHAVARACGLSNEFYFN